MKKTILSTIIITAAVTFWCTKSLFNVNNDVHHKEHIEHDHSDHEEHAEHNDEHGEHDEEITLNILREFGAEIGIASSGILIETIELPGEVQIDPDRLAHITPRFDGLVKEVFKQIGDNVKKGELLAIIESNESLTAYELTSSIDGVIISMHFTKGEIAQNTENFFAVADLSEVWVNLSVYQKYLGELKNGQSVEVLINSDLPQVTGSISFISPTLDKHTRTATARIVLTNSNGWLRPGQFVTGLVSVNQTPCEIIIPKTAIETVKGLPVVFAKDEHGFEPVNIRIGRENSQFVEIISGLKLEQQYIKKGGFILKAQMSKSSFGDGHNH
jgi:cobalt-zinc-cadmium efflux system membrane fusion protein